MSGRLEVGVFDHLDRGAGSLSDYYEDRLKIIEAYDRAGFFGYHVAEHHATPLGMAPSPTVFLAAVAQRTKRLRFGPMVFALPLYHPLRLIEEICMLDQMSGGRFEMGFGRGASPIELTYFGADPAQAERIYREGLTLILDALQTGRLDFKGEFFTFEDVPLCVETLQKPHPPLWYGVHTTEAAERAAKRGMSLISLDTAEMTRPFFDTYRATWRKERGHQPIGKMGLSLFMVVAETEAAALASARRAWPVWHDSFYYLFKRNHTAMPIHARPPQWDEMQAQGRAIAGTSETVADFLRDKLAVSGADYLIGQFAFGDLSLKEVLKTIELFSAEIMPALRREHAAAK
jgi:alkanesulfonate monooxygenase SsuD/methylene tetrahydromethanopterin reductase-like flavin-dependent oxidoreductase (luciferase family)